MEYGRVELVVQSLLDLVRALEGQARPLILCGGLGLYLRQVDLEQEIGYEPLIPGELWPRPRATEDVDVMLRTELLAAPDECVRFRETLEGLGYVPIESARYMQWVRRFAKGASVKVDLLTGPIPDEFSGKVRVGTRRVRPPRPKTRLHAHRTDEAIGFQDDVQQIQVTGACTDGQAYCATVCVPPPATFLMMKLFAFHDRREDAAKDFASHHALDLYRVVAMMSADDFQHTRSTVVTDWMKDVVIEAKRIVTECFASKESEGIARLQAHASFEPDMAVAEFVGALADLFAEVPS